MTRQLELTITCNNCGIYEVLVIDIFDMALGVRKGTHYSWVKVDDEDWCAGCWETRLELEEEQTREE